MRVAGKVCMSVGHNGHTVCEISVPSHEMLVALRHRWLRRIGVPEQAIIITHEGDVYWQVSEMLPRSPVMCTKRLRLVTGDELVTEQAFAHISRLDYSLPMRDILPQPTPMAQL